MPINTDEIATAEFEISGTAENIVAVLDAMVKTVDGFAQNKLTITVPVPASAMAEFKSMCQ